MIFLAGVLVCLILLNTLYKGINTIDRLDVVESERDQWQRPSDVIAALKLKEGNVVADVGSGAGYFALKLSRTVGRSGKVLAVDLRKLSLLFLWIRAFSRSEHNVRILVGDPDDPRLPAGIVDAVLIANTYHEFAHPERMLDYTLRSLRWGGRLVVLDRSLAAPNSGEEEEAHHHELPPELVDSQLRQKGLEILQRQDRFIVRASEEQWWLIVACKAKPAHSSSGVGDSGSEGFRKR